MSFCNLATSFLASAICLGVSLCWGPSWREARIVLEIVKSSRSPSKSGGVAPAELDEALSILVGCGVRRVRSRLSWLVCGARLPSTPMGRQLTVACVAQDVLAFFFCRTCLKAIRLQPTEPETMQRGLIYLFCIDQTPERSHAGAGSPSRSCSRRVACSVALLHLVAGWRWRINH